MNPYQYFFYVLGAIDVALGAAATGVFSTSNSLWNSLHQVVVKAKMFECYVILSLIQIFDALYDLVPFIRFKTPMKDCYF